MDEALNEFVQERSTRLGAAVGCSPEEAWNRRFFIHASKKGEPTKAFRGAPASFTQALFDLVTGGFGLAFRQDHADPMNWPTPQPLTVKLDPAPYPVEALPPSIRAAVEEVQGFVKAPVPLVASSALAAVSLAVQAHFDVERAPGLSGPVGLFLLTIADSGERKSTCDGAFTVAIRKYEVEQAEAAKPVLKEHRAAFGAWEAKVSGLKDGIRAAAKGGKDSHLLECRLADLEREKPEPPRVPRMVYGDATPESLKWNLAKEWPSGGVVSSEAGIVFGSHGMSQESAMRNLSTLNQLWDGADIATERRTSESFTVRGARLTMALQVQGPTLRTFMEQSGALARGSGFLARFLVACPESTQGNRPFTEPPVSWPRRDAFNGRIAAILDRPAPIGPNGALSPAMLTFTAETKAAWVAFHDQIEGQLGEGGDYRDVRDVASKIADNAARLAALFHVFDGAYGSAVGLEHFRSAARIAEWHLNESRRFFGEMALPAGLADAGRLESWLIQRISRMGDDLVSTKDVQQFGPAGLREKAKIDAAMAELEELGRAQRLHEGRRKFIAVNPALLGSRNSENSGSRPQGAGIVAPFQAAAGGSENSENSGSRPQGQELNVYPNGAAPQFADPMELDFGQSDFAAVSCMGAEGGS